MAVFLSVTILPNLLMNVLTVLESDEPLHEGRLLVSFQCWQAYTYASSMKILVRTHEAKRFGLHGSVTYVMTNGQKYGSG